MDLNGKRVLVIKGIGYHYHTDVLCPMVQDPMTTSELGDYTLQTVDSTDAIENPRVLISGRWYMPCTCVMKRGG